MDGMDEMDDEPPPPAQPGTPFAGIPANSREGNWRMDGMDEMEAVTTLATYIAGTTQAVGPVLLSEAKDGSERILQTSIKQSEKVC